MLELKDLIRSTKSPQNKPGFCKVFFAPWFGVIRPSAAADILERSSRLAFCTTFAFWAYFLAGTIILLALYGGTVANSFFNTGPVGAITNIEATRTYSQVWYDWHQYSTLSPAELILLFVPPSLLALAIILAWFFLPIHPNEKPITTWIMNALQRVSACGGMLISLVIVIGFTWGFLHLEPPFYTVPLLLVFYFATLALGPWALLLLASRTMNGTNKTTSPTLQILICEDCGYNLLHQQVCGRCPECGSAIEQSLTQLTRRLPSPWMLNQYLGSWLRCSASALFSPKNFYCHLPMFGPTNTARNFAVGHYLAIALCSATWMIIETAKMDVQNIGVLISPVALTIYPLFGWITHCFVGALSATFWLMRGELPNPQVLPKAFYYETPFLWIFCAYNGLIGTSIINGNWLFKWIGTTGMFNMPIEVFAILAGNSLLILIWLYRFGRVYRAVRWANF